jgi:plastocyanin
MPTRPRARTGAGLAFLALFAIAAPTALAADAAVSIRDFAFSPRTVEVRVGDRVTWTNRDAVEHTATARNGSFDTGLLGEGESASIRFTVAGTYRYICTPHPSMTGTVVVLAASGHGRPPNTDTDPATVAETPGWSPPLAALALVGVVGYLVAHRRFRRRETA